MACSLTADTMMHCSVVSSVKLSVKQQKETPLNLKHSLAPQHQPMQRPECCSTTTGPYEGSIQSSGSYVRVITLYPEVSPANPAHVASSPLMAGRAQRQPTFCTKVPWVLRRPPASGDSVQLGQGTMVDPEFPDAIWLDSLIIPSASKSMQLPSSLRGPWCSRCFFWL